MGSPTLSPEAVTFVCTLVQKQSAIELDAAKAYLIEARLGPVARRFGFSSTVEFIQKLQTKLDVIAQQHVVEAMTTNETSFYRDAHPFEVLRTTLLPEFIRMRSRERTLNIWSAACSTGQEAYSIAMLMSEHFPELSTWKTQILGTDISDDVLERARAACYSQIEVNRGLPAPLLAKYFRRSGMQWELIPQVRNTARFSKLNFIDAWPMLPAMDIVFLRNVLIYFSPDTKRAILEKIRKVMAKNAVLFLGAAETTIGLDAAFERVQVGNAVFYRIK